MRQRRVRTAVTSALTLFRFLRSVRPKQQGQTERQWTARLQIDRHWNSRSAGQKVQMIVSA